MANSPERKLRILQIVSSSAASGAERHVLSLSKQLSRRGHHVEVICPPGGWLSEDLRKVGITCHTMPMRGSDWFRTLGFVSSALRQGKFDTVHTHLTRASYFGAIGGLMRRVPAIASVHIGNHDQIYKRMAFGRNRLVAVSNYVRGMLHGRGIPDRFIETVYNGTDFSQYETANPFEVKSEFGIPTDKRLIGIVGRVCEEKGHLLLVRAMRDVVKEYPKAHLMLVGRIEQSFEPAMNDAVQDAGIGPNMTMTGLRSDVPRLLDAVEFSTMPSHKETFGIAAIEAMARGKAVVASRVGGLPEVVRHGQTGLLVDLRPESIGEAISYLLSNPEECGEMGATARQTVREKFTVERMVERFERVYEATLAP